MFTAIRNFHDDHLQNIGLVNRNRRVEGEPGNIDERINRLANRVNALKQTEEEQREIINELRNKIIELNAVIEDLNSREDSDPQLAKLRERSEELIREAKALHMLGGSIIGTLGGIAVATLMGASGPTVFVAGISGALIGVGGGYMYDKCKETL